MSVQGGRVRALWGEASHPCALRVHVCEGAADGEKEAPQGAGDGRPQVTSFPCRVGSH